MGRDFSTLHSQPSTISNKSKVAYVFVFTSTAMGTYFFFYLDHVLASFKVRVLPTFWRLALVERHGKGCFSRMGLRELVYYLDEAFYG